MMKKNDKISEFQISPNSIEAEQSVLGTVLLDNAKVHDVVDFLHEKDFYNNAHRIIYTAIKNLFVKESAIDLTTLTEELKRLDKLEEAGGAGYLANLEQYVITTENISHHLRIVKDKAKLRSLIACAKEIVSMANEEPFEVNEILDKSEKLIFTIAQEREVKEFRKSSDLTPEVYDEIRNRYKHKQEVTGVRTGIEKLDNLTSGFQRGDLIILAARPSIGKTALALNIGAFIAIDMRLPVGVFSLEMSSSQIITRVLCNMKKIPGHSLRKGFLSAKQLEDIEDAFTILNDSPLFIDDTPGLSILEIRARARRLKSIYPDLAMLVVDYLQLVRGSGGKKEQNRTQEVAEISRALKALAGELRIPIIAISQLSRMIEQRKGADKRPQLSDLRESGAIEQDADVVLFIHKDIPKQDKNDKDKQREEIQNICQNCQLIISKQRNGPLGDIDLVFFPAFTGFRERSPLTDASA